MLMLMTEAAHGLCVLMDNSPVLILQDTGPTVGSPQPWPLQCTQGPMGTHKAVTAHGRKHYDGGPAGRSEVASGRGKG